MYYSKRDHTFIKFTASHTRGKKYDAIITDKAGNMFRIPFGAVGYQQYKDRALGLFAKCDHNDEKRRKSYQARHRHYLKPGFFSPEYFAWNYLW